MKISYNWLKEYLKTGHTAEQLSTILTDIGLEVESVEAQESIKGGLKGLVVGEVIACGKHPNADKLSVTKVKVAENTVLDIVCGAPNVAAGQKVIVATEGTTLYPTGGEPFTIKKGKIRGETSEGMICAEDEIGMGDSHAGIIVLPASAEVGMAAADFYKIENDYVIEIGLTPNRSDATNHIGVAADLAAYLSVNESLSDIFQKPDLNIFKTGTAKSPVTVKIEKTDACSRYSGLVVSGITVKESPDWLKNRLQTIGVRPINNVVDITNFVLHETGQPLHAFDLKAIKGNEVIVKCLSEETKFLALDGTERKLSGEDLMICNGAGEGMCIAGVFGGLDSGVKETTTDIFLESAHFAARNVRRTSTRHLLRTDAATRFEKGTDPNATVFALQRAALLIAELAGGSFDSEMIDVVAASTSKAQVNISFKKINRLIGNDLSIQEVENILKALDFEIVQKNGSEGLTVAIPTNKVDVTREADVIEEILRIYGFNKVTFSHQMRSAISFSPKPDPHKVRNIAGNYLAANGFLEMMSLSLSQSKFYEETDGLVYINNTANQHLDVMRNTMLFGGLESIAHNQNRQNADVRFFEFGKTYSKVESSYQEPQHLSLWISGRRYAENWLNNDKSLVTFYTLKSFVVNVLQKFGIDTYQSNETSDESVFSYGLRYGRGKQTLVTFGEVKKSVLKKFDIKNPVFYADFEWDSILDILKKHSIKFSEISKFPTMRRDLALVINKKVSFGDINDLARKTNKDILRDINLFDVYENAQQLGEDKKSYAVSFTFRDDNRTMQDKDIDSIMSALEKGFDEKLGAVIRK